MISYEIQILVLKLITMDTSNSSTREIIPTMEITTIHTENEATIHVEHFFDI